jgi:putative spermidine/putrescine transport system permease protein
MAVMVRTLMSRLQRLDPVLEQASANLGATRWQTFRAVTFPLLLPAILAGAVFTFIEGFDNLSVTIFTHGYRDRPLLVELLALVQNTNSPLVAAVSSIWAQDLLMSLLRFDPAVIPWWRRCCHG